MTQTRRALIIGGHGKVALLATRKLVDAGVAVTSLFRNPAQQSDIVALGATPVLADVTTLSTQQWAEILSGQDVVIWSAGNGGRSGPAATYAVDRDAAISSIDAAVSLGAEAPRYIMVSFLASTSLRVDPDNSFYPYAEAKKAADLHLAASDLDYLILAPGALTEEPASGVEVVPDSPEASVGRTSSRELVAQVITEFVNRPQWPENRRLPIVDGSGRVADL
ncbi:NAD(P)H-binding protein [Corynebacterium pacaense]|uniref:NAD(P)H-binding protein n=1 Tax=Corynebacterium pacaense TaxID=1816684 RepID=UPI0009B94889|nr:NAD(P)H-binding protein [Corynebacterium pacaense]